MFLVGLLAALLGNCIIGIGQCMQKYGLNQLASEHRFTHGRFRDFQIPSRFMNHYWLFGIVLCYVGELCGNWVGLSLASAAVITPLGIVSVLVNAIVASIWLNETLTTYQKRGYAVIILGVLLILSVAPKQEGSISSSLSSISLWLEFLNHSSFLPAIFVLLIIALIAIYRLVLSKEQSILSYVFTAAVFASITVLTSKSISLFFRVSIVGEEKVAADNFGAQSALFVLFCTLIMCIVAQEIFKQQAYSKFKVSEFQPLFYASFNAMAVISNEAVFRELDNTWNAWILFLSVFTVGILTIQKGSLMIQQKHEPGKIIKE